QVQIVPETSTTGPVVSGDKLLLSSGVFHVTASPVRVGMKDVSLSRKDQDFAAERVSGDVALLRFSPLATPPGQKLAASKLKIGEMELSDGVLEFAMNGSNEMHVQHSEWNWLGGRVWADDFAILPGRPIAVTLH